MMIRTTVVDSLNDYFQKIIWGAFPKHTRTTVCCVSPRQYGFMNIIYMMLEGEIERK